MELQDCAFPLVKDIVATDDPMKAFDQLDLGVFIGGFPRKDGMERKDLLKINGKIFKTQGYALSKAAKPDCKVLVVANPANTNALLLCLNAEAIDKKNITCLTRLDQNRAKGLIAEKLGKNV